MKSRDLSVYDFKEEDELNDTCHPWSKLTNPKLNDDAAMTKYQFLQHASTGSITQIKEFHSLEKIHVVAIDDDDDHGFVNDISAGPQDSSHSIDKAAHKQSEVSVATSDRIAQEQGHMSGDSVEPENSSPNMKIRISCPRSFAPGTSDTNSSIPESPCSNASIEAGVSDGCDSIQTHSPSTSGSELEESYVPTDGLAQDQSVSDWTMEETNDVSTGYVSYGDGIITVCTDYVSYGDKYFPACLILFSKTSVKILSSVLEEEAGIFRFEWNIDDLHSIESQWCDKNHRAKVTVRILPRDAVQAENVLGMTGIEAFEYLVYDPHWPDRQERIMTLDVRYKALWRNGLNGGICEGGPFPLENDKPLDPYIPIFQEPFEEVVYPKGEADAVSISKRDVDLLEPDTFLNDTIIDFYMMYLKNEIATSDSRRFHFFNSFFFRKLADPDKNSSGVFDGKAAFQRVRKWTRKVNIFDKDYIFIPVNYNLHWSLIVICHPGEVATFKDENVDDSVKVPCILHMDSIRGSHAGLKDLVQSYLLEEWKEKQKETSEDIASKFLNLRFLSLELPQQENCSDCGLFLLHYAELFIAEAPEYFSPFQINKFDNFLKPDWFMPAEASLKRVHIQRLIYELLEGPPSENASPCNIDSQPSVFPESKEIDNGIEIISAGKSPRKPWNPLHSQPVQGLDLGLMDMSLYKTPNCTNVSGLGMRELFQQCQHYDQEASFGQPGCPMPQIKKELEAAGHLPSSSGQTELQTIDGIAAEACDLGYTPTGLNRGFQWNLGLSNQGDPADNLLPSSNCSNGDDSEEMMIIECEQEVEGATCEKKISDKPKENVDSLTESYESASSDMMETPAEDSQELAKIYGSNNLEDSLICNQEDFKESSHLEEAKEACHEDEAEETSHQKAAKEASHQDFENFDKDGNTAGIDEVIEDSCTDTDEEHAAKRMWLTASGDGEEAKEASHQDFEKFDNDGNTAGIDEVIEDSSADTDEEHAAKRIRLTTSVDGEEVNETSPQEEAKEASHQEEAKEVSQQDFEKSNRDGIDEVVEDSSTCTDDERAAKRIRLTTSGDGERELVINLSKEVQV